MLSDRRQIVLRALIEEYIARALPVGSRTLVERYNLGISSATVRNELSLLEEMGYLAQPSMNFFLKVIPMMGKMPLLASCAKARVI